MYHYRKDPSRVKKVYAYAAAAKMEGVNFFYFTPRSVDFEKEIIQGQFYEHGKWIKKETPFPDVIYNSVGPLNKKQEEIYLKLKKMVPFTSYPIGNKLSVYKKVKKGKLFSPYLIPYKKVKSPIIVLDFLDKYSKAIMKPISGSHGNHIIYIEKDGHEYHCIENFHKITLSKSALFKYVVEKINDRKFLIQQFINSKTKSGVPYDFRLHTQKNSTGKWVITLIYPRVGVKKGIVSNLAQGGQIGVLEKFLAQEFGEDAFDMQKYLEIFALQFSHHFDDYYQAPLDELGIDVGIDENKKIWLFEVNWRPGSVFLELDAAINTIQYASYLAQQKA